MIKTAANFITFQLGWFACVLGAANGMPWIGPAVCLPILALHLAWAARPVAEINLMAAALVFGLLLAGCGAGEAPQSVVVYVPDSLEQEVRERLAASPFDVTYVTGEGAALTDRVIGKQDVPRADVLVTSNAHDIWRAAERGALRPIESEEVNARPTAVRDPDRLWVAIDLR